MIGPDAGEFSMLRGVEPLKPVVDLARRHAGEDAANLTNHPHAVD
jgi:hypothetical protein